jgi:hypothetical protein
MDGHYQDRNQAFGQGAQESSGLEQQAQAYNALVPRSFQPTSVLHQIIRSPNGLGPSDAPRQLYGGAMLPTTNGMSTSTYERARPFMSPNMSF